MLIVFDLDGTLVDSRKDIADSANELIRECGGRPLPEADIGRMVGEGAALLVVRMLDAAGVSSPPADALQRFLRIYDRRLVESTRPYDGIPAAVRRASAYGRLAVLTNKPLTATHRILQQAGLTSFFMEVVAGDGPFARKPLPDGLLHLMRQADSAPKETLLVGDSIIDLETARRAGTRICLARYGFGYLDFPEERLRGDEWAIDSPGELVNVIERLSNA